MPLPRTIWFLFLVSGLVVTAVMRAELQPLRANDAVELFTEDINDSGVGPKRVTIVTAAVAVGGALLAAVPHGIYTQQRFGQAFYFQRTLVPMFYRNVEFVTIERRGCDGCPTPEEMARDSFSGRPVSMFGYLFRLHTTGEVVTRLAEGYRRVFLRHGPELIDLLGSRSVVLYAFYLVGFATAVFTRARDVLLIPLLSLNLLAFVVPLRLDHRLILHIAPFAAMLVVLGLATAGMLLGRLTRVPAVRAEVL